MENEKKRALAHVEKIAWIKPIEGADNIELVGVLGWQCIAKKGEFTVGDLCVYIEIDSKVPETDAFEFLRAKHFKIKTMKLNKFKDEYGQGVVSQGIALPVNMFENSEQWAEGQDITDELGVTYADPEDQKRKTSNPNAKYESMRARHKKVFSNKWVRKMMKHEWFRKIMFAIFGKKSDKPLAFPSWIRKTDEERIENMPKNLEDHTTVWEKTEKIDGTSSTYAMERPKKRFLLKTLEPELIVCSRNVRQRTPDQKCWHGDNVYWEMAFKYNLKDFLAKILETSAARYIILQGETYGQNLQGNPYKMDHRDFAAFNLEMVYDDGSRVRLNRKCMGEILEKDGIPCVPFLGTFTFPEGVDMHWMKSEADGVSAVNNEVKREGIVYRDQSNPFRSFKNVSNDFLLSKK